MERRPLTEIGVSALIATICAVFLVQALSLPPGRFEPLGSGPVPIWTAAIVILCCLSVAIKSVLYMRRSAQPATFESELEGLKPFGGVIMLGLTIAYIAALQAKLTGFGIITFVYLFLLIIAMEEFSLRRLVPALILSAVAAFGAQYVFTEIFVVDLPV